MNDERDDTPLSLPLWVVKGIMSMAGRVVPEEAELDAYERAAWAVEQIENGETDETQAEAERHLLH